MLSDINSPLDIKSLSYHELNSLASEIRRFIIEVVSKTGGHLAPNLGAVELTLAIHKVFNAPKDRIIWDVGHQSYTHKIITGRREKFHTLRQHKGISGFPHRKESEYDVFGTGHSSTSISAGLGITCARDLKNEDFEVICVIGDGAMTAGMAYEGINQTGFLKKKLIVILNDNHMSISENVGGMSRYLLKISTAPIYNELKKDVWELLGRLPPSLSERARLAARKLREGVKNLMIPTIPFEELGLRYIGPFDGHNIPMLVEAFESVKNLEEPVLIHVLTEKGRGYEPARNNLPLFHGLGPFDIESGEPHKKGGPPTYTDVFGKTLCEIGEKNDKVVAITAAMPEGTGLCCFRERFKERFFDVGIAEQHAVTFASGMAIEGYVPVCAIYSTFLQRGFDQVIHDVALQNIPVVFCLDRAGLVGEDGPTHHGAFDITYLRMIPNMVIMSPKDENELVSMLTVATDYGKGPIVIRYPRTRAMGSTAKTAKIRIGKGEVLRDGRDGFILAIGSMVYPSIKASDMLKKKGFDVGVFNARFAKPIDGDTIIEIAQKTKNIITCEENALSGGFGSAVAEFLIDKQLVVNLLRLGIPDRFIEHGARDILLKKIGLTGEGIAKKAEQFLKLDAD
ncbi:MAG: 1-deoxy-D-xylulose-5-phosphate synthase [candidate division WOR-3 bacterium]|nr:1-deoxy-D-xylulose-5-phosphate synthase [candidate division WOR-3 bacterium]